MSFVLHTECLLQVVAAADESVGEVAVAADDNEDVGDSVDAVAVNGNTAAAVSSASIFWSIELEMSFVFVLHTECLLQVPAAVSVAAAAVSVSTAVGKVAAAVDDVAADSVSAPVDVFSVPIRRKKAKKVSLLMIHTT